VGKVFDPYPGEKRGGGWGCREVSPSGGFDGEETTGAESDPRTARAERQRAEKSVSSACGVCFPRGEI